MAIACYKDYTITVGPVPWVCPPTTGKLYSPGGIYVDTNYPRLDYVASINQVAIPGQLSLLDLIDFTVPVPVVADSWAGVDIASITYGTYYDSATDRVMVLSAHADKSHPRLELFKPDGTEVQTIDMTALGSAMFGNFTAVGASVFANCPGTPRRIALLIKYATWTGGILMPGGGDALFLLDADSNPNLWSITAATYPGTTALDVAYSGSGNKILTCNAIGIDRFDYPSLGGAGTFNSGARVITTLCYCPTTNLVVGGGDNGADLLNFFNYDAAPGPAGAITSTFALVNENGYYNFVRYLIAADRMFIAGEADQKFYVWNPHTNTIVCNIGGLPVGSEYPCVKQSTGAIYLQLWNTGAVKELPQ